MRRTPYYSEKVFFEKEFPPLSLEGEVLEDNEKEIKFYEIKDYPSELDELRYKAVNFYEVKGNINVKGKGTFSLTLKENSNIFVEESCSWAFIFADRGKHDVVVKGGSSFITLEWFISGDVVVNTHIYSDSQVEVRNIFHILRGGIEDNSYSFPDGGSIRVFSQLNHIKPSWGRSNAKAVVIDGRLSMEGMIKVWKSAKVDSYLEEHALLLSERGKVYQYPSLEIEHNDVKASHSASTFFVEDEDIFYLQSRGFDRGEAIEMIVEGYVKDYKFIDMIKQKLKGGLYA